ncbi:hypothetical protein BDZ45DRAFT_434483 [Acephala macrosclerotiorum]|nr:hypothetical protein BDZ45DRAFT_434483 [Acephala macrosclerotiorum]
MAKKEAPIQSSAALDQRSLSSHPFQLSVTYRLFDSLETRRQHRIPQHIPRHRGPPLPQPLLHQWSHRRRRYRDPNLRDRESNHAHRPDSAKDPKAGSRTINPTLQATENYREHCEAHCPRAVMSENCSSWFNGGVKGGRLIASWLGSGLHTNIVRREPKWEDWEYSYWLGSGNRFEYFENGRT